MTRFLSLLCALGLLAGVRPCARHGADTVSFVPLGAATSAAAAPAATSALAG